MQISKRRNTNGIANTHHNNDEAKLCGAAAVLAMGMLRAGSRVEVWADGCFWAARVTRRGVRGVGFVFDNTRNERGFVHFGDFLSRWRFPLHPDSSHFTARTVRLLAEADYYY